MICPKCGSENVFSQQDNTSKIIIKHPHHAILWWLLLGWIYLAYVLVMLIAKFFYWLIFGWFVNILKFAKHQHDKHQSVHVCQNCGYRWKTSWQTEAVKNIARGLTHDARVITLDEKYADSPTITQIIKQHRERGESDAEIQSFIDSVA